MQDDIRKGLPSCSNAERLTNCNGSQAMMLEYPEIKTNADATKGTLIHAIMDGSKDISELPEEDHWIVNKMHELREDIIHDTFGDNRDSNTVIKEKRYWLKDKKGNDRASGQLDYLEFDLSGLGLLIDYKSGRGDYEDATINLQLRWLAVLLKREHDLKRIKVAIIQPLSEGDKVSYADYDEAALSNAEEWMIHNIKKVGEASRQWKAQKAFKDGQLYAGNHCKYCPALGRCPATRDQVPQFNEEAAPVLERIEKTTELEEAPSQELIDMLPHLLDACTQAERTIKAIRTFAKDQLFQGVIVDNWYLKDGSKVRSFSALLAMFRKLKKEYKVAPEEFLEACTISATGLKNLLKKKSPEGTKAKEIEQVIDELAEEFGELGKRDPSLKKRPAQEAA